jgi:hypothetical protein
MGSAQTLRGMICKKRIRHYAVSEPDLMVGEIADIIIWGEVESLMVIPERSAMDILPTCYSVTKSELYDYFETKQQQRKRKIITLI